ncbi:hypothetical protein G6F50_017804 [Rhizopus delemar]|uniref:Ankyrin repeat domain-containing protein n=1 Tax=Rhizopus delemar TaxID=936053 RepID=A0A9P6XNZ8_9FUNG|nr:hypothetical protein G6F50_017804 [Rhizopus delemar]
MLIDAGVPVSPPAPDSVEAAARDGDRVDDRAATPPLLIAVTTGQAAVVDALLAKGADPVAAHGDAGSPAARRSEAG